MSVIKRPTSSYWYTNFLFDGKPVRRSTGTSDRQKAQEYEDHIKNQMWEQKRLGVKPKRYWLEAVTDYMEQLPDSANKRNTAYNMAWINSQLKGSVLQDISRGTLADLQKRALREGRKPATVNRLLAIVSAVLNKAVAWEWIDRAPKVASLDEGPKRLRYLTQQQAEALLIELRPHARRMAIFALETGLRRSNVTHLRWDWVDLERRLAVIPNTDVKGKTRSIAVPLSSLAVQLLESVRGEHPDYVFPYKGKPVTQTATKAWRAALTRAGISDFRWHDLRHTWASWHAQGGTPERILQDLGGWQRREMVAHYGHLAVAHLAPYVEQHRGLAGSVLSDSFSDTAKNATLQIDSKLLIDKQSGNSSVGRAQPCQPRGQPEPSVNQAVTIPLIEKDR